MGAIMCRKSLKAMATAALMVTSLSTSPVWFAENNGQSRDSVGIAAACSCGNYGCIPVGCCDGGNACPKANKAGAKNTSGQDVPPKTRRPTQSGSKK